MDLHSAFFKHDKKIEYDNIKSWRVVLDKHGNRSHHNIKRADSDIRPIITGDLLFFNGSGLVSTLIKTFSYSKWNHIGTACWCEVVYIDKKTGRENIKVELFCYELGSQPFTDLITRKIADMKTRLVRLSDIITMYDLVSVRHLNHERDDTFCDRYQKFMYSWKGATFFKKSSTLIKAFLFTPGAPKGEVTCSQMAAIMLDEMKIYKVKFDASQLCPAHYTHHYHTFPDKLFLGPETPIYYSDRRIVPRTIFIIIIIIILVLLAALSIWRPPVTYSQSGSTLQGVGRTLSK